MSYGIDKKKMTGVVSGIVMIGSLATMTGSVSAHATSAAKPATAAKPLAGKVIVLDAGHNVKDRTSTNWMKTLAQRAHTSSCENPGTNTNAGYEEPVFTWDATMRLKSDLEKQGAKVELTRTKAADFGPCIVTRANILNNDKPDIAISIHADGAWGSGNYGFHVIYPTKSAGGAKNNAQSKVLATVVRNYYQSGTGMARSTYIGNGTALSGRSDLGLMNNTKYPTILVESGNMRNIRDARLQTSATWRQKEANAITNGVLAYFHK